jgi:hypothetical protein
LSFAQLPNSLRKSSITSPAKWLLIAAAALPALLLPVGPVIAQEPEPIPAPIEVLTATAVSEFPIGIRFSATAVGEHEITSMAVRFRIGLLTRGVYEYLDYVTADINNGELFWRTATAAGYIPPETIITYNYEIEDSAGNLFSTEEQELIFQDARFNWERVEEGPVSVAYHGPVKVRAEAILQAILDTLEKMGPVLGAGIDDPIRVVTYNNQKEMLEALPPRSAAIGRELVTEGQAFSDVGTLMVLIGGRLALGTASHEVTHILNHRAGQSIFRRLPSWLHEGLAEYGNVDPGFSYDIALEFAVATDRLMPHLYMQTLPGDPEDVIIFYGQSKSIVRFMIDLQGEVGMRELLSLHKRGINMDDALQEVYGLDRLGLTNAWRAEIGAEPYELPKIAEARPTPVAYPTVQAFTLTPQAGGSNVGDVTISDEIAEPTPELQPEVAVTTPPQEPEVALAEPSPSPTSDAAPAGADDAERTGTGSCNATGGSPDSGTLAMLVLMVGAGGGAAVRRKRR